MDKKTILYDPSIEEEARSTGWYLNARDKFVIKIVKKFTNLNSSKKVLDGGCGQGGVLELIKQDNIFTVGNDMAKESIKWGIKKGRITNGIQASLTHLPFKDNAFDISICTEVLEHVKDDLSSLRELNRVTKNKIIITVPAHTYLWTDSDDMVLHQRRYSKKELLLLIKNSNMKVIKMKPFGISAGIMVLIFKLFFGRKYKKGNEVEDLSLASRYKIPKFIATRLNTVFSIEGWLSMRGLAPWGHTWWACVEKKD
jgi:ubiquinone/menaquinone biosynthesis C-methylase UbiE